MTQGKGWFEEPDPRTGICIDHQKAALKGRENISNAEIKPSQCADSIIEKLDDWDPNDETVEDLIDLLNELDNCPDYNKDDPYVLGDRLSVADGYQEFADDYSELPLWTVDYEGNALIGEDAGTIKHVNEIDEDYFAKHGFTAKEVVEIQDAVDAKMEDDDPYDEMRGKIYRFDDGTEWIIFEDYDTAERQALRYVRQMLEDEPEMFTQSWLQHYISMTDTDRRMIADEEATDYACEQIDEDEAMKESGLDKKLEDLQEDIDFLEKEIEDLEEEKAELESTVEDEGDENGELGSQISDIESDISRKMDEIHKKGKEQEALPDEAREKVQENKYDEIYEELEDPVQYFVEDHGIYTIEDLMEASFTSIDTDEAAQDAIDEDGVAHFLASYDENVTELDSGIVMYRVN
ncbi:hypothetical protein KAU33_08790 [Candidatus Dependentiae bacterium]|nr:hypothetical protein [Candidatus Dependentiae bacterium]